MVAGGLEARGQLAPARVRAIGEQAVHPLVQVGGEMGAELDGEVEGLAGRRARRQRWIGEELIQDSLRRVHRPLLGCAGSLQRLEPLAQAGFLTDVDLLTGADEPHEHAPFGDALAKLDKGLRLGLVLTNAGMFLDHLLKVPRALCLVVDDHVLWRDCAFVPEILLHVVLDAAHEGLAAAAGAAQLVLQDLDEGPVATEEDGRRRWLTAGSFDPQVVEAGVVDRAQAHQGLAGPRNAGHEHEVPSPCAGCLVSDVGNRIDGRLGLGQGAVDRSDLAVQEELAGRLHE